MIDIAAAILGLTVAFLILRHPLMRSARAVGIIALCTVGAAFVARAGLIWGAAAATAIGFLPLFLAVRYPRLISALGPADLAEHKMIEQLRDALRIHGPDSADRERRAILRLKESQAPSPEWIEVRHALLELIELNSSHREGRRNVTLAEAQAARQQMDAKWWSAIQARRRFFR